MDKKRKKVKHEHHMFNQGGRLPSNKMESKALTLASYQVAYRLAKNGRPFSYGELIKELVLEMVAEICPEKTNLFKKISLARATIARRIDDLGRNITKQIADKARNFQQFSLALGELMDVCGTSQLLVFIRGVNSDFSVTQEFASVHSMDDTVTGEDIFRELEKTLLEYKLEWSKLNCVTMDRGRNISGVKEDLVGLITKAVEAGGFSKPMFLHSTIYQQELRGKYFDMSCVLEPVASILNYIQCNGLSHCHFYEFLEDVDSEFIDLHDTAVQWLSCEKVLSRFFELREEIKYFLEENNRPEPLLSNTDWLWKLVLFVDLAGHMNQLNRKLENEKNLITDAFSYVKEFRTKLLLLERELLGQKLDHFPFSAKFHEDSKAELPSFAKDILRDLQKQFYEQFSDLEGKTDEIKMFENPFDCDVDTLPAQYQLEIIDVHCNNRLRFIHREEKLVQFYKFLDPEQFPNLKQFARGYVSIFGSKYLYEQTFSKMKYIKSERTNLSEANLKSMLILGTSSLQPQYDKILQLKHQLHRSH